MDSLLALSKLKKEA